MSYARVIPRDLFNEANLLKCYGQLYICLEPLHLPHVELVHDGDPFAVEQAISGEVTIANIQLNVRGEPVLLHRPLNSRQPWPLYLTTGNDEELAVFADDGSFSPEMLTFLLSD